MDEPGHPTELKQALCNWLGEAQSQLTRPRVRRMAKRRKRWPNDDWLAAEYRQHLREVLPPGVTLDDIGELCQAVSPLEARFGCRDGAHSTALATRRLTLGEFPSAAHDILAWLADVGGVCDCTINTTALSRVVELSADLW